MITSSGHGALEWIRFKWWNFSGPEIEKRSMTWQLSDNSILMARVNCGLSARVESRSGWL